MSNKNEDIVIGRNAVKEALRSNRNIDYIMVSNIKNKTLMDIFKLAKSKSILIKEVDNKKLDFMADNENHQGIIAVCSVKEYSSIDDIFKLSEERNEPPFIIILDEIEDPHNLGAIIRTAECAGAHGIIIPKRRSAGLTYSVGKTSAGALEYVPVVRVPNISSAIDDLKKRGVWVYGTDMVGSLWCNEDLRGAIALVIGNEGKGMSRLVKEKCDKLLSLPMKGKIQSLNASVAAGIMMYEISRQRGL